MQYLLLWDIDIFIMWKGTHHGFINHLEGYDCMRKFGRLSLAHCYVVNKACVPKDPRKN